MLFIRSPFFRFGLVWLALRRQRAAKEIEEGFGAHRDEPRRVIAAMRHDPRLAAAVAFGLGACISEIQILNALHLDVQPVQGGGHDIWTFCAAAELLSAPRIESILATQRRKLALADFPFSSRVHVVVLVEMRIAVACHVVEKSPQLFALQFPLRPAIDLREKKNPEVTHIVLSFPR
jgi:hypothetical protein